MDETLSKKTQDLDILSNVKFDFDKEKEGLDMPQSLEDVIEHMNGKLEYLKDHEKNDDGIYTYSNRIREPGSGKLRIGC